MRHRDLLSLCPLYFNMYRTVLVDKIDIDGGKRLLQKLDKLELEISAAFWLYIVELDKWRLIFATKLLEKLGPIKIYDQILSVLDNLDPPTTILLKDISIVSPENEIVQAIKFAIHTELYTISEIWLSKVVINNIFIESACILCICEAYKIKSSCIGYREQAGQHVLLKNSIEPTQK